MDGITVTRYQGREAIESLRGRAELDSLPVWYVRWEGEGFYGHLRTVGAFAIITYRGTLGLERHSDYGTDVIWNQWYLPDGDPRVESIELLTEEIPVTWRGANMYKRPGVAVATAMQAFNWMKVPSEAVRKRRTKGTKKHVSRAKRKARKAVR